MTDLFASGAVLRIGETQNGSEFSFPRLHIGNLSKNKVLHFDLTVSEPALIGSVDANGSFGPFDLKQIGEAKLDGRYSLNHLDLSRYRELGGVVSSEGKFHGVLANTAVQGKASVADFEVTSSGHKEQLSAEFQAMVNGTKGNVSISQALVHLLGSALTLRGGISGAKTKTTMLDVKSQHARVQDLLFVFVGGDRSPLDGDLGMQAHVVLPPGNEPFLQRVCLDGNFSIDHGLFTTNSTQDKLDSLSSRARGDKHKRDSQLAPVAMGSNVKIQHEVAYLRSAFFAVPGAVVRGGGSYNLKDEAVDLSGKLAMHATLSQAATGFKSLLAAPLDPFFKKHGAGAVLPIRITGTYSHPKFKVSL